MKDNRDYDLLQEAFIDLLKKYTKLVKEYDRKEEIRTNELICIQLAYFNKNYPYSNVN